MKITIEFWTDNAAFDPGPEIAHILRRLADRVEHMGLAALPNGPLQDTNGNTIGRLTISGELSK